jgi:hypothetical protein
MGSSERAAPIAPPEIVASLEFYPLRGYPQVPPRKNFTSSLSYVELEPGVLRPFKLGLLTLEEFCMHRDQHGQARRVIPRNHGATLVGFAGERPSRDEGEGEASNSLLPTPRCRSHSLKRSCYDIDYQMMLVDLQISQVAPAS